MGDPVPEAAAGRRRIRWRIVSLMALVAVSALAFRAFVYRSESITIRVFNESGTALEEVAIQEGDGVHDLGTIADGGQTEATLPRALAGPLRVRYRRGDVETTMPPLPFSNPFAAVGSTRIEVDLRIGPNGLKSMAWRYAQSLFGW